MKRFPIVGENAKRRTLSHDAEGEVRELLGEHLGFAASEAYKLLRTNLMFTLPDEKKCRIIGITSAARNEGKSTTTINLGYSLAQSEKRVLILEADMRLPTFYKRLELKESRGLSNVLAGMNGVEDVIQPSGLHENLKVIASGAIPPNPSELLGSAQMKGLLEVLGKEFDFILLDLPPVAAVSDSLVVSAFVSGILFVVRQNYTNRRTLDGALRQMQFANAKLLGFVMTGSDIQVKGRKYYRGKRPYRSENCDKNGGEAAR